MDAHTQTLPLWGSSIKILPAKEADFKKKISGPKDGENSNDFYTRYVYTRLLQSGLRHITTAVIKNAQHIDASDLFLILHEEVHTHKKAAYKKWLSESPAGIAYVRYMEAEGEEVAQATPFMPPTSLRLASNAALKAMEMWDATTALTRSYKAVQARNARGDLRKYTNSEAYLAVEGMSVRMAAEHLGWSTRTIQKMRDYFANVNLATGEVDDDNDDIDRDSGIRVSGSTGDIEDRFWELCGDRPSGERSRDRFGEWRVSAGDRLQQDTDHEGGTHADHGMLPYRGVRSSDQLTYSDVLRSIRNG